MFKPIEIVKSKLPKENPQRTAVPQAEIETPSNTQKIDTTSNSNNNNTQRKPNFREKKSQKQQSRQQEQNQPNTVSDTKMPPGNKEPKHREPKYQQANKTGTKQPTESVPEPALVKDTPQQKVAKTPTQQYYVPKHRAQNQNNTTNRKQSSERENVPKQQSAQVYKPKQTQVNQQVLPLSYLPQITQFPTTFSATCRVLQVN